jgi:hypothetical protein
MTLNLDMFFVRSGHALTSSLEMIPGYDFPDGARVFRDDTGPGGPITAADIAAIDQSDLLDRDKASSNGNRSGHEHLRFLLLLMSIGYMRSTPRTISRLFSKQFSE